MGKEQKKGANASPSDVPEIMNEEIIKMFKKIDKKMDEKFDMIKNVLSQLEEKIQINSKTMESNTKRIDSIETRIDKNEQYSRLNNLRIYGVKEEEDENLPSMMEIFFRNKFDLEVSSLDIDKCYRMGPYKENKLRPILIRFTTFRMRSEVYANKKKLKKTGFVVREDLTKYRIDIVKKAVGRLGVKNVWTLNGNVYIMYRKQKKIINTLEDLPL